ncbi:phosphoribosylformylglycinamidine synthase subunit PurS [Metasolibacillus sp. FSL H7-0170]|uniref:phosphoribosylformylglycinamidine synthase subunit PurS n=1 Tax=Metasolibacillus TaxID=2703677 RepID=UPI000796BBA9|nr:phosphoribosylformylglycinamidine synthase subunit PurS [Metasolibacillus fluoroglycofenilyticus]KYG91251.1 phosphoribosylformylglycinamidine synthase subunit PurS [[Bacillus] sp. KCTC 13219]
MKKVKIYVTLKESIIEPQGTAASNTLKQIGYEEVQSLRVGKYLELTIADTNRDIDTIVKEACEKVLVNTIMENYRYEVEEA